MEQGKEEEDAINKAIVEFGDIDDLKKELELNNHLKKIKKYDKIILEYSIWGSLLIILYLFLSIYYSPEDWFVYPTFAVLWWPLTMYFRWMNVKVGERKLEEI